MTITASENDIACAEPGGFSELAPRPYWLDKPCPPWCRMIHTDHDEPRDRCHQDSAAVLTRTMEEPLIELEPEFIVQPSELEVYTVQAYREEAPHLVICHDEKPGVQLTLAEARQLAEILMDAVRQAESGSSPC